MDRYGVINTAVESTMGNRDILAPRPLRCNKCPATDRGTTVLNQCHAQNSGFVGFITQRCDGPDMCEDPQFYGNGVIRRQPLYPGGQVNPLPVYGDFTYYNMSDISAFSAAGRDANDFLPCAICDLHVKRVNMRHHVAVLQRPKLQRRDVCGSSGRSVCRCSIKTRMAGRGCRKNVA